VILFTTEVKRTQRKRAVISCQQANLLSVARSASRALWFKMIL